MASSRKILWTLPGIGQLRCNKKNPQIQSVWLDSLIGNKRWKQINLSNSMYRQSPGFEEYLRRGIDLVSRRLISWADYPHTGIDIARAELYEERLGVVLDHLFRALSGLVPKSEAKSKPS